MNTDITLQFLKTECQRQIYTSSRGLLMIAMATFFLIIALILACLSFLPQTTLPFSGVYFVMGSFLVFISAGILLINTICDHCSLFNPIKPSLV